MKLKDSFGRNINYLRLSITDRCNYRCSYCMPENLKAECLGKDILTFDQLLEISNAAISTGIEKIRITGGEPLVRTGIVTFIQNLSKLEGLKYLALTTNGSLLGDMAEKLKNAGLDRINISLDSLNSETFSAITGGGDLESVKRGISAAFEAGMHLKLNMVPMKGVNDSEIVDFAALTLDHPYTVRFIEYMPSNKEGSWRSQIITGDEIISIISKKYRIEQVDKGAYSGPSRDFRIKGGAGTLGIITPVYGHFCSSCNRIRVTSKGFAKSCLFSPAGVDLKPLLGKGGAALSEALKSVVICKPERHRISVESQEGYESFAMAEIGG